MVSDQQTNGFMHRYETALREYLRRPEEESLTQAYELGRLAVAENVSLVDLTTVFFSALDEIEGTTQQRFESSDEPKPRRLNEYASEFLIETLATEEMARASYREAAVWSSGLATMAASIAHEFRNTLTSVLMAAETLDEELPQDQANPMHRLSGQVLRGVRLLMDQTEEMLDVVAFQGNSARLRPIPLETTAFLAEELDQLRSAVEGAGLRYVVDLPASLPSIVADPKRIRQVLVNLISNAIKYGFAGRLVEVSVSVDSQLVISVRDAGEGIPAADQERLFQPFYRANRHRRAPGVGVGLSLVKQIVEAHEGSISVRSAEGAGTTFTVRLPFESANGVWKPAVS